MEAIKSLAKEIQNAAATVNEAGRKELLDSLRDLQYSIEKPEDTMQRVIHLHLVIATTRIAIDLKLFDILGESDGPLQLQDLSSRTGADPKLLGRILRMLSSLGMIKETGEDEFTSSQTSKNLSIPEIQAGLYHNYDVLGPSYQVLPDFLASTNYQSPTETHKAAFQEAWNTDLPLWLWFQSRPKETAQFNRFMIAQRSSTPNAFSFFPIEDECKDWPAEKPLFVDVGGASGQQAIEFKKRFPDIKGRVVFQDLPGEIEHAVSQGLPDGVEAMVHDFYTPQVVKGAKFYYLRAILHDHLDDKATLILKNIMQVMDKDSLVLLDEMVLPNHNVDWFATQTDLTMLAVFGSAERTEAQWRSLLDGVGLKIRKIVTYTHAFRLSVIAASL